MRHVFVSGVGLWTPQASNVSEWFDDERRDDQQSPSCEILPSRLRRATSLVIRMGAEVIGQSIAPAGVNESTAKLVFGSAYGEFQTAVDQMEMMASDDGRLSPSRFKNSVHNTVTGLLSIALKNRGFGTAIAAGSTTLAMCLLEGLSLLDQEGGEVVIAVADSAPDEVFRRGRPSFLPLGVAFCLTVEPKESSLGRLFDLERAEESSTWLQPVPDALRGNPAAAGLPLLNAVVRGEAGRVPVDLSTATPYSVSFTPSLEIADLS